MQAAPFISGESYTFSGPVAPEGQTYSYSWSVSDGSPLSSTDSSFLWTAPVVTEPSDVVIGLIVSNGAKGCTNESQLSIQVIPRKFGEISLEKTLDARIDPDNINVGDIITYIITITNTGETNVTHLPLADVYPNEFLKAVDSNPPWSTDESLSDTWDTLTLKRLVWDNLLEHPLSPGDSVTVTARFQVIRFQQQIMNLARVEGAKDDTGETLEPKEKDFIIAPVQYECPSLGPDTACVGEKAHFSSPLQNLPSYQWEAMDENGNPVGGFNDTTSANVTWTAPETGNFMISFNNFLCSQTVAARSCKSAIKINKTCDFESPVMVGDTITYHFEVTNTGDQPLHDVNLTDAFDWGPNCEPTYISGDDGNDVLDPGESWLYECPYVVQNPMDYPKLHTMGVESSSAKTQTLIRNLMEMKVRLEIEMDSTKSRIRQFDAKATALSINEERLNGINYTLYNYTNEITGEGLSKIIDSQGRIFKIIYTDCITGAILATVYDPTGKVISDELYFPPPRTREYLKVEYDVPSSGYRTFTITDYKTRDTLILVVDERGNILSKEYRKTPGYRPFAERYFLKNTATVKAKDPNEQEVSDSDSFSLEIFLRQPMLRVTKVADPEPVKPDGTLNYTIVYENLGGADAHEVVLKETFNKSLIFQRADPAPDIGTMDTWTLGDLLIGEFGTIKIRTKVSATASPGSKIRNIADLTCKENSRDIADINTTVAGIGLNITKSASAGVITPGASLTYFIDYRNEGTVKQTNVVIHDYLDANVEDPSFSPDYSGHSGNHYWWNVGDLNPEDEGTIEISVRVKKPLPKSVTSIINTYRMNSLESEIGNKTLQTLVVQGLWIDKKADVKEINRDENITYTIRYGNADPVLTATGVTIEDTLPPVELLGVSRSYTQKGNVLNLTPNGPIMLKAGENGTIIIVVHVPKEPEMNFHESSSVQGEGYVYVRKKLSTAEEKPALVNSVKISGYYQGTPSPPATSSAKVTIIGAAGTRVRSTEHGSGHYEEDEISSLKLENRSITLKKEIFAKHRPTTFSLPGKRSINYNSLWFDFTRADNRVLNEELSENYLYVDTLSKNSSFVLDKNQTVYRSEAQFSDGLARINYQKHSPDSKKVTKLVSEDYHGSFKVLESIDSYGDSVKYAKSSTGKGFVASDVRPSINQKSYEYGSGYYNSEEVAQLDSVTKSSKMYYAPLYQTAGSQDLGYFIPWKEGMWTKDPEKGLFMGEEIRYASYIKKDAEMLKSRLSFLGEFNGTMDIKLVSGQSPKNETRRLEQIMVGSFKTDTAISVYTNPMHLTAHVYVTKKAIVGDRKEVLFLINVTNDGNKLLKPLIVTDCMPEGLIFINSSIRPEVKGQIITWTVPALDISRTLTIKLRAKIKGDKQWYLNEVNVKGSYKNTTVQANNSTFFQALYEPLPCCGGQSDQRLNLTKIFSVSKMRGNWGYWAPAPCFGVSSQVTDCFNQSENYYDNLDRTAASCACVSPYDVP